MAAKKNISSPPIKREVIAKDPAKNLYSEKVIVVDLGFLSKERKNTVSIFGIIVGRGQYYRNYNRLLQIKDT